MGDNDFKKRDLDDVVPNPKDSQKPKGSIQTKETPVYTGNRPFILFDPARMFFRYTILFFICFLTFGSYFSYDNPGALPNQFKSEFHINNFEYLSLYSVYSWPNTVQVFFGGWLIDRFFGLKLGALVFCALVMAGQIVFAVGATVSGLPGYGIALAGRFIFGLGGESLSVAQSTYTAKWFRGKELAMAFGIALSFSRVGSAINFNVLPTIDTYLGFAASIWTGAIICVVSVGCALILAFLDNRGEKAAKLTAPELAKEVKAEEKVSLLDVRFFPLSIWLIYGICVSFYIAVFVFISIASEYLQSEWGYSKSLAGHLVSIPYLMSAGISPVLGFVVDKIGRSAYWIVLSCGILTCVHLSLSIWPVGHFNPIVALVVMGVSYSTLAATLWPSVPLLVNDKVLGTAFGLMTALQNLGLAVAPLVVGQITNKWGNRTGVVCLAGSAGVATMLAVLLFLVDMFWEDRMLTSSAVVQRKKLEPLKAKEEEKVPLLNGGDGIEEEQADEEEPMLHPRTVRTIRHAYLARLGVKAAHPGVLH